MAQDQREDPRVERDIPTRDRARPAPADQPLPDFVPEPEATETRLGWIRTVVTPDGFTVPAEVCAKQDGTLVLRAPLQTDAVIPAADAEAART